MTTTEIAESTTMGQMIVKSKEKLADRINALQDELDQSSNSIKSIKLIEGDSSLKRRNQHHLFVIENRNVNAVCQEIVESLANFLLQRIDINDKLVHVLKPFINFKQLSQVQLEEVHQIIGSDLDTTKLPLEYAEVLELKEIEHLRKIILVAKQHNVDVERLISTSNILKSSDRLSLLVGTENEYLFVHFNMPPLTL
ncbi:Hypothetical protein CINCED_3A001486 [Cinara cedri]|uniref:Uncharacterized protein n=1 Tax=Cinara cedri TaxID=506608 RepID=A0A5E4N2Z8_9HEMI|nr:Hypothetical protein CINCED_3A001486 [Cinara cedri]